MTTIIALQNPRNHSLWIGSDTLGTAHDYKVIIEDKINTVILPNGKTLIWAVSGNRRLTQLISHAIQWPDIQQLYNTDALDLEHYAILEIVPRLYQINKDYGVLHIQDNMAYLDGSIMVGYRGEYCLICSDMQVLKPGGGLNYWASGSGYEYALGALAATQNGPLDDRERIIMALRSASLFDPSSQAPFILYHSRPQEIDDHGFVPYLLTDEVIDK